MTDFFVAAGILLALALLLGFLWVDFRRVGQHLRILGKNTEPNVKRWIHNQLPYVHIDGDLTCPICLDQLHLHEQVKQLPCQHCYHEECLMEWGCRWSGSGSPTLSCPLCRVNHMVCVPPL
ncbi:unnamed protein product [Durusdinium trenchii]|uniref:RING-type domain-containing protein n=1 Tax=Durusdinium trenchii TaxID=1381693 RepID=A0ABP0PDJ2_9DINO